MISASHRYSMLLTRCDGTSLAPAAAIPVDWQPVEEEMKLRCQRVPELGSWTPDHITRIEPVWHEQIGAPCIRAVSASCDRPGAQGAAGHDARLDLMISQNFFADTAHKFAEELVADGTLKAGDEFLYFVLAEEDAGAGPDEPPPLAGGLEISEGYTPPPLVDDTLSITDMAALDLVDEAHGSARDFPVLIPRGLLRETAELTDRHAGRETGGVLIGRLLRPTSSRPFALVVDDHIHAVATREEPESLAFTPQSWAAARAELARRGDSLLMVGWYHSHPAKFWRRAEAGAAPPRPASASTTAEPGGAPSLFSRDDALLHRVVFAAAHSVALVATHRDSGVSFALYGWRDAMIRRRAYRLFGD